MKVKLLLWLIALLLNGCAPFMQYQLEQTIATLPSPPKDTVLLVTDKFGTGGSDCAAYTQQNVYGSPLSIQAIVEHYELELSRKDWQTIHEYDLSSAEVITFKRYENEFLGIYSKESISVETTLSKIQVEKLATFETIYIVEMTRTCG